MDALYDFVRTAGDSFFGDKRAAVFKDKESDLLCMHSCFVLGAWKMGNV